MIVHVCCAPDATVPFRDLKLENWDEIVGYFYGSNIHPEDEYVRRREAVNTLAEHEKISIALRPYDPEEWFSRAASLAAEPERGARCGLCFSLQL